ncbi:acyltransferase [Flavobacterium sp. MMLR14_040]|uniref:acyltransferase family protein n=1 Tax=Flavobacterium sp. MMLR14_040 TaxID=3093843 RepID=UPI0029905B59|nr:acyltransferase [Flavobacterium sp. MMLR14_040]MDW8849268.1 acyltransferase [Flavobacterium sp. MMLR14_040]
MNNKGKIRIDTLDWLRGVMALSIMFYHLKGWEGVHLNSHNFLGRLGVYGVSIFFILSGLSMAIVYNSYIKNIRTALNFIVRRIFRIWPMLWLVSFYLFFQQIFSGNAYSYKMLIINLTTVFGFIRPSAYMATGAWSIGNEMVYYVLTPLILFFYNYKKVAGNLFFLFCLLIGFVFAFYILKPVHSLSNQWNMYINPFNNLFLYVSGIAIYYNFEKIDFNPKIINSILLLSLLLFCFLPFTGDQIVIVTGIGRIIFVLFSILIVFCFYKLKINLPFFLSKPLELLGVSTYGVYIIHPLVYFFLKDQLNIKLGLLVLVPLVTILFSILLYNFFELKFINMGKKLTSTKVRFKN